MTEFWDSNLIYKVYGGSISYGTNTKDSDVDVRGVCIPPEQYLLGLHNFEHKEDKATDTIIYSLRKFIDLAMKNNPNILEMLFVESNHIIFCDEIGKQLRKMKHVFLSKQIYKTYGGYAYAQLKRLCIYNPDTEGKRKNTVEEFGYDTKNALHLIRLLKTGIEALSEGEIQVLRYDNQYLLDIKKGQYPLEYIQEEAKRLNDLLDIAYVNTKLPNTPNFNIIEKWLIETHKKYLKK